MPKNSYLFVAALLVVAALLAVCAPQAFAQRESSLLDLSLEELVNLQVTSVSRRAEPLGETTSAVYVITRDDIESYGLRSIPEALRLVPGISAFQIDGNKWAIGSRGSVGRFANKLLVLMDGRILYTPSFSGVFWDVQDTLMQDIERIEVIRGPGSTAWGSNAVNGVINIITRKIDGAEGPSIFVDAQDDGSYRTAARFTFQSSQDVNHRLFVKRQDFEGHEHFGFPTADSWNQSRVGYRMDWASESRNEYMLIAEGYDGESGTTQTLRTTSFPYVSSRDIASEVSGAFLVGRWTREHSPTSSSTTQFVFDDTDRLSPQLGESRQTYGIEYQRRISLPRHELVLGAEYRSNSFEFANSETLAVFTHSNKDHVASAFVQDQFELVEDKLDLVFGTKFEHSDLSDRNIEVMPSLRLLWQPQNGPTVWAAATHSVRIPSYADLGARVRDVEPVARPGDPANPFPIPMRFTVVGSDSFRSEELRALEVGIRGQASYNVSYDLALFNMDYHELRAYEPSGVFCEDGSPVLSDPLCVLTSASVETELTLNNQGAGTVRGLELAFDFDVGEKLRFRTTFAYTDERLRVTAPSQLETRPSVPRRQLTLRNEWSITPDLHLTTTLRYVDKLPMWSLKDYWQGNLQLNWRIDDDWSLSLGARNLFAEDHLEFVSELLDVVPIRVGHSYFLRAEWGF